MKTIFSKNFLPFGAVVMIAFLSCNGSSQQNETRIMVDSVRNVEISIPDSVTSIDIATVKSDITEYFDNSERFYLDTTSTLSTTSLALKNKAYELRQKLLDVLPKISITTGLGENKFSRDYYIVEGDIKLDRDELLLYCKKRLLNTDTSIKKRIDNRKLTVATDRNGHASIWPNGSTIKYCIMRSSFSSKAAYDSTVKSMQKATEDWMKVCNIKFQYLPNLNNQNIDLETYPEPIFFIVRQIDSQGDFIAQAFFPNDPIYERMLLVDNSFFNSPYNKAGIIRHELGHILGFRHEHIWSNETSCKGEDVIQTEIGARSLTPYDPYSVMHYPCGVNKDNTYLNLTDFDITGSRKVYPFNN